MGIAASENLAEYIDTSVFDSIDQFDDPETIRL
jgi:hypothetical protein